MSPSSSRGRSMRRKHALVHMAVITLLYFCQGLIQGTLHMTPLLILQRYPQLSPAWVATLGIPVAAFVLKFLWAPAVDRVYIHWGKRAADATTMTIACSPSSLPGSWRRRITAFHRRVQWIVALQMFLIALLTWVAAQTAIDDMLRAESVVVDSALLQTVFVVLSVAAFCSATQDIAIDAWAVEGLPESQTSRAGMLQLVGVISGILFVNLYIQLQVHFPVTCSGANFFRGFAILLSISIPLVCYLALLERVARPGGPSSGASGGPPCEPSSSSPPSPPPGIWQSLRLLVTSPGTREILTLFLTRGWGTATQALIISRLISLGLISASTWARYTVCATVLQLILGSLTATRAIARFTAAGVCRRVAAANMVLTALSSLLFVFLAFPSARAWYSPCVVFPLTLVTSSLGAYVFVSDMTLAGSLAHRFPNDSGSVLTLVAAIGNLGNNLPPGACLFMAGAIVSLASALSGKDTRYGLRTAAPATSTGLTSSSSSSPPMYEIAPLWITKMDVVVCAIFFGGVGVMLFFFLLAPATHALERDERTRRRDSETTKVVS